MGAVEGVAGVVSPQGGVRTEGWRPDKTAFLKLLAAQLQYQNPMEPVKNEEFLTQMVQFTILEQLQEMSERLARLGRLEGLQQGAALLGRRVTVAGADGESLTGPVEKVVLREEGVGLVIGGRSFDLEQVLEVLPS
ncbi:MAG: flagellar biosynthesis protein FlgD [Firmicutes bacterium]|nr:flagellar biosynthesis protein FlgD [Bacillota bacterium]